MGYKVADALKKILHALGIHGLLVIVFLTAPGPLHASSPEPFTINPVMSGIDISPHLYYLNDTTGHFRIDHFLGKPPSAHFAPLSGRGRYLGYTRNTYWFCFQTQNNTGMARPWLLELAYPLIDHVTLFFPTTNGYKSFKTGDRHNFSSRPYPHRQFAFPLGAPPGLSTYYLQIKTDGAMTIPLKAWSLKQFQQQQYQEAPIKWIFYGLILGMVIINLFVFVFLRERFYLFLALFIGFIATFSLVNSGLAAQYLWPNAVAWGNVAHPFFFLTGIGFALAATKEYLRSAEIGDGFNRAFLLLISICFASAFIATLTSYFYLTQFSILISVLSSLLMVSAGIKAYRNGFRYVGFYALSWFFFLGLLLFMSVRYFSLIPLGIDSRLSENLISIVFLSLVFLGILDKIKTIHKDKEDARLALQESEETYRTLLENAHDGVLFSVDKRPVYANKRLVAMVKGSVEDFYNKSIIDFIPDINALKDTIARRYEDRLQGKEVPAQYETQMRDTEGNIFDIMVSASVVSTRGKKGILSIITDISQLKSAQTTITKQYHEIQQHLHKSKTLNSELVVTHRQLLETNQKLTREGNRLRVTLGSIADGVVTVDIDGRILSVNKSAEKLIGMTEGQVSGMHCDDIIRLSDHSAIPFKISSMMTPSSLHSLSHQHPEQRVLTSKNSDRFDVEVNLVHVKGISQDQGAPFAVLVIRDITEQLLAENALKRSEERYRIVFENTGSATLIARENKIISFVNSQFESITGYKREEVVNKMVWESLLLPEDLAWMNEYHQKRLINPTGAPRTYELRIRDARNSTRNLVLTVAMIEGTRNTVVSAVDVTEIKRTEKALEESRKKLSYFAKQTEQFSLAASSLISYKHEAAVFDKLCDVIISYSEYRHVMVLSFSETQKVELIGQAGSPVDYPSSFKLPQPATSEDYINLLASGIAVGKFAMYLPPSVGVPWHDEHDSPLGSLVIRLSDEVNDLTGLIIVSLPENTAKPTTESVRPLEILASMIGQTLSYQNKQNETKRLERLLFQAQKMESIGTLSSGIAHDFNNLMTGILGNVSLIQLKADPNDPMHEKLDRISRLVESGANLTKQLLGVARGGRGETKAILLNDIASKCADLFGRTRKNILITSRYTADLDSVRADITQIEQVLLNLFVNASHAMPDGGEIHVTTRNTILTPMDAEPFGVPPGPYACLSVRDTGVGMDDDTIERIFEPFFTTKEMGRGTGLGLASAYGIIKSHNGIIDASSKKGQGATFTLYLPSASEAALKENRTRIGAAKGIETILIVDDEDDVSRTCSEMLMELGYEVLVAGSGPEALSLYELGKDLIDLVILDIVLPNMGGAEIFDRLKVENPSIKVLLASGFAQNGIADTLLEKGAQGFIQKPFGPESLSQQVRKILDAKIVKELPPAPKPAFNDG